MRYPKDKIYHIDDEISFIFTFATATGVLGNYMCGLGVGLLLSSCFYGRG